MSSALLAFVAAFALVVAVELPDKTFVATLVLSTRFRSRAVLTGVIAAFAAQAVIAVAFGSVLTLLPDRLVSTVVGVLFGAGSAMLLRQGFRTADDGAHDAARMAAAPASFGRGALSSFGVLFAAEWGDASQLATAGLAARYAQPLAVGLGSFFALVGVAALAVLLGHKIRNRIHPRMLQRVAGFVFAGLSAFAFGSALLG
ncbi:putative Ca2+/H+ antiporter (TMEM165/GDT1 family) [Saccharomonospora amisosensis]|uniref:GDT1 family protein n=1 Tax=Saccharomonospora amisosensis TaxID=1128677 RepID=A0A7X5ZTE9_9PSEU|nr:TMEM165/GDT1 family protein [Saccharomonospora amisosensis]NIJ14531.1 putative Ca2+/H+ antiporter (TMEM165/GDT1 family) [Saccharomonospora amisosensis]